MNGEPLRNIQEIYSFTSDTEITRLLYAIFEPEIERSIEEGKRVIIIEFASTKRLVEWYKNGDCSVNVSLFRTTAENGLKILTNYPNTAKAVHENPETVAIVLATNLIISSQSFAATGFLYKTIDLTDVKKKYYDQFDLKCKVFDI